MTSWIQTASSRQVFPLNLQPEDICIEDIAHALSNLCRFAGHTCEFYSVAQHSVLVSYNVQLHHALHGLLHDASEAYLCDLPRPWKKNVYFKNDHEPHYVAARVMEDYITYRVFQGLRLPGPSEESQADVHAADQLLLVTEARDLMSPLHPDWEFCEENGYRALSEKIVPLLPQEAKQLFLARYFELCSPMSSASSKLLATV